MKLLRASSELIVVELICPRLLCVSDEISNFEFRHDPYDHIAFNKCVKPCENRCSIMNGVLLIIPLLGESF